MQRALARSDGNVSAAAQALGISRATLHRKLGRLGLSARTDGLSDPLSQFCDTPASDPDSTG